MPTEAVGIDDKVAALRLASTWPDRPAAVEVIETHMSWLFLTSQHAWKLKKPVRTSFLDFSTLAARQADCLEELRLNRRLAADVYLDVVALTRTHDGALHVGQRGEIVDWLVKMRRLPAARMLDRLIREDLVSNTEFAQLSTLLVRFYRGCRHVDISGMEYRARLEDKIRDSDRVLRDPDFGIAPTLLQDVHHRLLAWLDAHSDLLDARAQNHVVEGHGDLRPEHICMETPPVIFDCLEFNPGFRLVDIADELAFLAMECERIGSAEIGRHLFRRYTAASGDTLPRSLLSFYKAAGACLRAGLAILHLRDTGADQHDHWRVQAVDYIETAARHTRALSD